MAEAGAPAAPSSDMAALARGGRTNIFGFVLRLAARLPFLFIAGRSYGPEIVGRFALAVVVVELAALLATLGLKRGLAQALATADRPHAHIVWDGLLLALIVSAAASSVLFLFPKIMFPNSPVVGLEWLLPLIVFAIAWSDVALAALAYRLNVRAAVTARAVIEPWTISIAAWLLSYVSTRDGLVIAYVLSMVAALVASLVPLLRSYGVPVGWSPQLGRVWMLARQNAPLAGADAIEWATRNVDRFILGLFFAPAVVGIYYMAQQVASLPSKLKTSFDPVLGPVITRSLAAGDLSAIARQVRQVGFWIMAAQGGLALMGSVPGEAVMGVVGPEFVSGTAALAFLLVGEVLAANGAVAESALVYIARLTNLWMSAAVLAVQVALSIALILAMRSAGWPTAWQAAGPAVALAISLALGTVLKATVLGRLLGENVVAWRWPLLGAALVGGTVGALFTMLPPAYEWAELLFGEPAIALSYMAALWLWAFRPDDRALFRKVPNARAMPLAEPRA